MIGHRESLASDEHFVLSSWLRSFQDSYFAGCLSEQRYFDAYRPQVQEILARPETKVTIAVNTQETDPKHEILGYVVYDLNQQLPVVHWVYVKDGLRKQGLAKYLFKTIGIDVLKPWSYSFRTPASTKVFQHLFAEGLLPMGKHNPYYARKSRAA